MNSDLVSIVTPNFNSEKYIIETANSILNQKYENWEWIIVDDNSSDNSVSLIKSVSEENAKIRLFKNESGKKGGSVCRNLGLQNAKGKWIMFLDSDDVLENFCLENRVQRMNENTTLDFGVFAIKQFYKKTGDSDALFNRYFNTNEEYLYNFIDDNIPWQTSCSFWKRDFLLKNNINFSEAYQRLQDVEFHSKILLNYTPQFVVFRNELPDSYYRVLQNTTNKFTKKFVENLMASFLLFFQDFSSQIKLSNRSDKNILENYLFKKYKKSVEILLLQAPVYSLKYLIQYNKKCTNLFFGKSCISNFTILLFFILNYLKLNKVKGLGVYRVYKIMEK